MNVTLPLQYMRARRRWGQFGWKWIVDDGRACEHRQYVQQAHDPNPNQVDPTPSVIEYMIKETNTIKAIIIVIIQNHIIRRPTRMRKIKSKRESRAVGRLIFSPGVFLVL